jgi:sensor histidine kinase YesM
MEQKEKPGNARFFFVYIIYFSFSSYYILNKNIDMKKPASKKKQMAAHKRAFKRHLRAKNIKKKKADKRRQLLDKKARAEREYKDMLMKMINSRFNG